MSIPNYHLYAEPVAGVPEGLVSVRTIEAFVARAGSVHHLHRHAYLYQLTYVTGGGAYT